MKKIFKKFVFIVLILTLSTYAVSCSQIQGNFNEPVQDFITSFEKILNAMPGQVKYDEANMGWAISAPNGAIRFIWSKDWSQSPSYDVMIEFDASPFINAGLDPNELPNYYKYQDNLLSVGLTLGKDVLYYEGNPSPLASYKHIVNLKRNILTYNKSLDNFSLDLANGNMFQWTGDIEGNDKDIMFVLNPDPLIKAGVNPIAVTEWLFAKMSAETNGKLSEVNKFLKSFNLEI